ncbi:MAG TPA: DUF2127 domain-containing protein [Solirubrobacteraceae bacterium]|jgi:uncharacterized membrane protein (DUF2068 family)|nr:DUF2127 domain-containing protein [Solirubrobacteraceae bacterium]
MAQEQIEATFPERHGPSDRLLPWIAAERGFRAIVLVVVGVALLSHPHENWASDITRGARELGLDPSGNAIRRIVEDVSRIGASRYAFFGTVALAYGALEGAEAYGLWRRRRWAEWLTVIATSLLFVPEIWELTRSTTLLKLGAIVANVLIVAYLIWRLRRE